jgi:putative DNA primase/helicase
VTSIDWYPVAVRVLGRQDIEESSPPRNIRFIDNKLISADLIEGTFEHCETGYIGQLADLDSIHEELTNKGEDADCHAVLAEYNRRPKWSGFLLLPFDPSGPIKLAPEFADFPDMHLGEGLEDYWQRKNKRPVPNQPILPPHGVTFSIPPATKAALLARGFTDNTMRNITPEEADQIVRNIAPERAQEIGKPEPASTIIPFPTDLPVGPNLAAVVREAVEVYAKTGKLLDAALIYAKHGIPIFPVDHRNKRPIPKRDPDPTGKFKLGIPGTGGFYKATCDPVIITQWWKLNPRALIAVPMGPRSGVWCVDVDTGEEHVSGIDEWNALLAEHEPFETREHRSATGGPHVLFKWEDEQPIGCSKGKLKEYSLSVKGQGGYILIPPSVRKGRAYTVFRDIDPIKAPQWLVNAILIDPDAAKERRARKQERGPGDITWPEPPTNVDLDEIAEAMEYIPNNDCPREEWMAWGLCLFAVSGGSRRGFEVFDKWSCKSNKYHGGTHRRWFEMTGSPPDRTGANKIFKAAREHGWQPRLPAAPPTYASAEDDAGKGRNKMHEIVRGFLFAVDNPVPWQNYSNEPPPPITHAACIDVGIGKTEITIKELARWLKNRTSKPDGPFIYATPRHNLNERIEQQFAAQGINARIYRGREADDPQRPGQAMCVNLPAVRLAKNCHADIATTCCKNKKQRCRFFEQCGYQRQLRDHEDIEVWILAIDTLFHVQKALGEPIAAIVDEALWQKGLRGVEANKEDDWSIAVDSIFNKEPPEKTPDNISDHSQRELNFLHLRHQLASALRDHPNYGGIERKHFDALYLNATSCKDALSIEWAHYKADLNKLGQHPGMSELELNQLASKKNLIDSIKHTRRLIQIWEELRDFLNRDDIEVSGRLTLTQDNGQLAAKWRGIKPISSQFRVHTLLLDATLPPLPMLQIYHPRTEIVADIKVKLPNSVHIRQLLGAPTSARKLNREHYLIEIRRHILARYLEFNRPLTLVICQQRVDDWLKTSGLPDDIAIEHYNNVTGIDAYRDVRLMLLIGRTAPGPQAMETLTAALTGKCPVPTTAGNNGFHWYHTVQRGIRLRNGSGVATRGDLHPDPEVEAVRRQIHEAELVQALGRGRAVNRTAANPLNADLLFDTCLPITVDKVERWQPPSLLIDTAIDGVMLTAPCDLMQLWPKLWPNRKAATRTLQHPVPTLPGFEQVEYQLAGPNMKKRVGFFDPTLIPDPRAWLETRLGRLI